MITTLVFDMDGTLINSDSLVKKSYQVIFEKYRPDIELTDAFLNTLTAPSIDQVFSQYFKEPLEILLPVYLAVQKQEKAKELTLFPMVKEVLSSLKKLSFHLVLWTNEVEFIVKQELSFLGIDSFFDLIITRNQVNYPKPSPEGMHLILSTLKVNPREVLFIGDQQSDWEAARASKVHLGAVSWSPVDSKRLLSYQPECYITKWSELIPFVLNYNQSFNQTLQNDFTLQSIDPTFRILQFTDLHLMDDEKDELTFQNILRSIQTHLPHLIVITGDLTMSPHSRELYTKLGFFMDQFKIPWTFVFGNHDTDYGVPYDDLVKAIKSSQFLLFKEGPKEVQGVGNFSLLVRNSKGPHQLLIFLDSHIDTLYPLENETKWGYATLHWSQINWVEKLLFQAKRDFPTLKNLLFFHIPTPEYHRIDTIAPTSGEKRESPSTPPFNSGLLDMLSKYQTTQAIFVGHDHYNDYVIPYHGIQLVYGRVSGHYDYGIQGFPKGSRLITIQENGTIETQILFEKDYV